MLYEGWGGGSKVVPRCFDFITFWCNCNRCKEMLRKTSKKCNKSFASVYNKCRDVVGVLFTWLLCWPMKLTFICNIVNINIKTCDPSDQMKSEFNFGSEYLYLKKSQKLFSNQFKNISIKVKFFHSNSKYLINFKISPNFIWDNII